MKYGFLDKLLEEIININCNPNLEYKQYNKKSFCLDCGQKLYNKHKRCEKCWATYRYHKCPISKEHLHWLIWNCSYNYIKEYLNTSFEKIKQWLKDTNINEIPTRVYKNRIARGTLTDYQI